MRLAVERSFRKSQYVMLTAAAIQQLAAKKIRSKSLLPGGPG